ncbi:MAG TPA: hypothetical protein VGO71_21195 [Baekduia sp.]|jgi:hypothetical protein|nr:hypothetical protein [Baekduia sp.]
MNEGTSQMICVNAQNTDGSWAGNALCSSGTADHPYNHIYYRRGIVCASGGGNSVYGWGEELYIE